MKKAMKVIERVGRKALQALAKCNVEKAEALAEQIREVDPSGVILRAMIEEREERRRAKRKKAVKKLLTKPKVEWINSADQLISHFGKPEIKQKRLVRKK